MNVLVNTAAFLFPFLLIRISQKLAGRDFLFGVVSDLFLISQVMAIFGVIGIGFSTVVFYGYGFVMWGCPVLCLADALMVKHTGIRLRLSLLHHARSAGDFWESAVSIGFYRWLGLSLAWAVTVVMLSFVMTPPLGHFSWMAGFFILSGLLLIWLERRTSAISVYRCHNLLVLEEQEALSFMIKKKHEEGSLTGAKDWLPVGEQSFFMDENFPLLRITKEFQGSEHFSLHLGKEEKPHIIFLCLESFRACGIPCIDSYRPIQNLAPCFERLAKEGIIWDNFYSESTRSCKALLATLYGIHAQVGDEIFSREPGFSLRGLPDILKEKGYLNAYLHNGDIDFDRQQEFLLSHRFDVVHGKQEMHQAFEGEVPRSSWGIHDEYLMRYARDFLMAKEKEEEACFLYLFSVSNHHPWRLPPGVKIESFMTKDGLSEAPFLQTMHYTDKWLGWFIEELRQTGVLEKSLVFIFGDHGQPLDEHREKAQQREGIYEEAVRVPLLLLGKGIKPGKIDEVSSQIDLLPTLIDMLSIKSLHHSVGRSLKRKTENTEALFFSPFFPKVLGCRRGPWKLIHNPISGEDELFHLERDPGEKTNAEAENREVAETLRKHVLKQRDDFEELYKRRRFFPAQDNQEYVEIDLRGRPDLQDEELIALLHHVSPSALFLDGCLRISDRALSLIAGNCRQLRHLSLKDCTRITEKGMTVLAQHTPLLKSLDLSNCLTLDFSAMGPVWKNVPLLQKLKLRHQPFLNDEAVEILMSGVKHLERLDVPQSSCLSDKALFALAENASSLTFFSCQCSNMTENGLQTLFAKARQLRGFSLEGGYGLTDRTFTSCGDLPNLVTATFVECPQIEGRFLASWERLYLDAIHFAGIPSLCDEALAHCASHSLRYIYLCGCPRITDSGALSFREIRAKEIHLIDCPNITREAVQQLRKTSEQVFWR